MEINPSAVTRSRSFRDVVVDSAGREIFACYQCFKCSAGCPVSFAMDLLPHQIIRAVILGQKQRALSARTIWTCASCETCSTRCPNEIDVARVMDVLRQMHIESGAKSSGNRAPIFHTVFLDCINRRGRVHELSLMRAYTLQSGELKNRIASGSWKNDAMLGLKMLLRGKLKLTATSCKSVREVRNIFNRARELKKT